jgi:hypothetical protein
MKHVKLFEQFLNESKLKNVRFISHKTGIKAMDQVEAIFGDDTFVTYGIFVKDTNVPKQNKGVEFLGIESGSKYFDDSAKKSFNKFYYADEIPAKWKSVFNELKGMYEKDFKE